MFKLTLLALCIFVIFSTVSSKSFRGSDSGVGPGCNCTSNACSCCDDVPHFTSICLDSMWNAAAQTIEVKAVMGGLTLGDFTFTTKQNTQCLSVFGGNLCVQVQNLSIVQTGACGCFLVDIDFFGVKAEIPIGCFNYGYGSECPDSCSNYDSCDECDKGINCGWCNATQTCVTGDQNGPYPPGNCTANWIYHESSCNAPLFQIEKKKPIIIEN